MRGASRPKKAVILILMLVLPVIDQVFGASLKADGEKDKGQPEMAQPLDNHPMEWTVGKEGESSAAVTADSYRYSLMQRTDDLLAEALDMLARVKDSRSRRWLETFIYKMGELAVQLGGKHLQRKAESSTTPSQVLPTPQPIDAVVTAVKPVPSHLSDNQVTSTQLSNVLPVNEAMSERQVVTKSGFADDALEEDELVRQLHDQIRIRREEQKKMEKPENTTEKDSHLYESIRSEIRNLHTKDDEKQLLMDLAKELNELSDLNEEEQNPKENHDSGHLASGQLSQQERKLEGNQEPHGQLQIGQSEKKFRNAATLQKLRIPDSVTRRDESMVSERVKPEDVEQNSGYVKKQSQSLELPSHSDQFQPQNINRVSVGPNDHPSKIPTNPIPRNNFMYDVDADRLAETKRFHQNAKFQKKSQFQEYSLKNIRETPSNIQNDRATNTARHPMLQNLMLSHHGHNAPHLYSHPQKNVMDVYDSPTDVKIHNANISEPSAPAHSYEHVQSQSDGLKMKLAVHKKGNLQLSQMPTRANPNQGFKSARESNQNQHLDSMPGEESGNSGDFHFDQGSVPEQVALNSPSRPKMQRQLRAGKILILSDKFVKANFKNDGMKANATKPKENYETPPGTGTQNIFLYGNGSHG